MGTVLSSVIYRLPLPILAEHCSQNHSFWNASNTQLCTSSHFKSFWWL